MLIRITILSLSALILFQGHVCAEPNDSITVQLGDYDVELIFTQTDYMEALYDYYSKDSNRLEEANFFFNETVDLKVYQQFHDLNNEHYHYFSDIVMYKLLEKGLAHVHYQNKKYSFEDFRIKVYLQGYCNQVAKRPKNSIGKTARFILDNKEVFKLFKHRNKYRRMVNCI